MCYDFFKKITFSILLIWNEDGENTVFQLHGHII